MDSGSYIAGAVALESGDLNTAGVAMFKIKPKTEGVRLYWAEDLPAGMTLAEAEAHNVGALLESDGVVVDNAKVTCTYKKKGLFSSKSTEFPKMCIRDRGENPEEAVVVQREHLRADAGCVLSLIHI